MNMTEAVRNSADLKERLLAYAATPGFVRRIEQERTRADALGMRVGADPDRAWVLAAESAIFGPAEPGRLTLLERYLMHGRDLSDDDRVLFKSWRTANVTGVFRVVRSQRDSVVLHNLVDGLDYRVYSNVSDGGARAALSQRFDVGSFLQGSVLPVQDAWVFNGEMRSLPAQSKGARNSSAQALQLVRARPDLPLRNPAKAERAREIVERNHELFVESFDGETYAGGDPQDVVDEFGWFCADLPGHGTEFLLGAVEDQVAGLERGLEALEDDENWEALADPPEVGLVHHPVRGLHLVWEYSLAFAPLDERDDPLLPWPEGRQVELLRAALDSDIPSAAIELLVGYTKDPDELFGQALERPDFRWERDWPGVARAREPGVDQAMPGVVMLPDRQSESWT
jgi:hypothetical protein